MATVRDSDISLWLHNKLGTSNDSWTSGSICSQLNSEVLRNIKDCFPDLQTQVKLKLLLSFFHIPRRCVDEWKMELEEIIEVAQVDSELWVSMLAEIMKTFSSTGMLNTSIVENEQNKRVFLDLVSDLKKLVRKQSDSGILPLECHYLNKTALHNLVGQQSIAVKHFTLKRKPKSAALRAELLQKSVDAQSNIKKSAAPTVPVRSRNMPRKMTDTTPLKGIPSRIPVSGGFGGGARGVVLPRTPNQRKDGGIKLLDINEQPMNQAAKKRKKALDAEELAMGKKVLEAAAAAAASANNSAGGSNALAGASALGGPATPAPQATPDYAVGLVAPPSVQPPPTPGSDLQLPSHIPAQQQPPTPSYAPTIAPPSVVTVVEQPATPAAVIATIQQPQMVATPTATAHTTTTHILTQPHIITQHTVQTDTMEPRIIKPVPPQAPREEKKLSLSREQFKEAQEIFRTANKVTRPEKALILGFMAGLRDNPCPHLGNVITIKLSEDTRPEDGMIVENHFQMNYSTGEWNVIQKCREP